MLSTNVLACIIIASLFIILGLVLIFTMSNSNNSKDNSQQQIPPMHYYNTSTPTPNDSNNDMNYVTAINNHLNEDFGMYEGSLSNWYSDHSPTPVQACNTSVNNYTRKSRDIRNISSVNTTLPFVSDDYMPYDETSRFQTPALHFTAANFNVDNYLRSNQD